MSDSAITFTVLGAVVVLFISGRLPVEIVAIASALTLYATDVLELDQALAGFSDPAVIFIATLFVVSEGLDASGVSSWAGQLLSGWAGHSRERLLVLMMLAVAALTALISVNGAVAALLPVVVITAYRLSHTPSQLLMPLVFAAHAGSLLALTGTPVNVLVSEAAKDSTGDEFNFFEFALLGIPLLAGTLGIVLVFGERLLPQRTVKRIPADLSRHAHTLVEEYLADDNIFWLRVRPGSPMAGKSREAVDLKPYDDLALVGVQSTDGGPGGAEVRADDLIVVRGSGTSVQGLAAENDLAVRSRPDDAARTLLSQRYGLAEVVIPPRSDLIGQSVFPGMTTESGDLVVLAVQRGGEDQGPRQTLVEVGDTLLLQGSWDALDENLDPAEVLVVDAPEAVRRQAAPLGTRAQRAVVVLAVMVILLATGLVTAAVAGLLAASAMIVLGVVSVQQAYRGINWTTVILVAAMLPLSTAMAESGAAEQVANRLVDVVGDGNMSRYLLLVGLFLITATFGQLISNTATALVMIPIGLSGAAELGISPEPVLMCLTVAAAASLLTPVATPVNLMVMEPAGYRFGDYWKLGLPLMLLFFAVAILLVPVIWTF